MVKRLEAGLIIIGLIILLILPFIIAGVIIVGVLLTCSLLFKRAPQKISRFIYAILTPLLIVGWVYYGYSFYTNEYYNTYVVYSGEFSLYYDPHKAYTFFAKTDEEAYIKTWQAFITDKRGLIDSSNDWDQYHNTIIIFNKSKGRKTDLEYDYNIDSLIENEKLYYRKGKQKITFKDILWN